MLETVHTENSEQFLWENGEQFYLMQKTDFLDAVSKFEYTVKWCTESKFYYCRNRFNRCRKIGSIIVKFKHEKAFRFDV